MSRGQDERADPLEILAAVLLALAAVATAWSSYEASRFARHRRSRDPAKRDSTLVTASNLVGSPEAIRERVAALADAGVDHCAAIAFPAETVDELLDQWGLFSAEILSRARG